MDKKIDVSALKENVFKLIGSDWMLITAGDIKNFNTMTASWGGFGVLWNKNVAFCFVRPTRHTYSFMENAGFFTLCFFDVKYKDILTFCGTHSGRNVNKIEKTGLLPAETVSGNIYFKDARIVIECRKIYFQDINPKNFLNASIGDNYPEKDYHKMYIGEIVSCILKE